MRLKVDPQEIPKWTLLSAHGHVFLCVANDPAMTVRDIARGVGITERHVSSIIRDLGEAGYISKTRQGSRNRYTVNLNANLRHPALKNYTVGEFAKTFTRLEA